MPADPGWPAGSAMFHSTSLAPGSGPCMVINRSTSWATPLSPSLPTWIATCGAAGLENLSAVLVTISTDQASPRMRVPAGSRSVSEIRYVPCGRNSTEPCAAQVLTACWSAAVASTVPSLEMLRSVTALTRW